jgi:hypothetical protein
MDTRAPRRGVSGLLRRAAGRAVDRLEGPAAARGLLLGRAARRRLLPRTYYSPIPDLDELTDADWDRRSRLAGIELDLQRQMATAEAELGAYVRELYEGLDDDGRAGRFALHNPYYPTGDAEIAYAIVRRHRPRRILELGSGHSTLLLAQAAVANEAEGSPVELVCHNPFDPDVALDDVPGLAAARRCRAQDVPVSEFQALEAGDVVFVDTSHTVKLAGEVNHLILEVLPALAAGVLVHFHDIWLPWEYPRILVADMGMYWNEQYLLQAFLAFNAHWEVLFAAQALSRELPERFRALLPRFEGGEGHPSGFWIRRV